MKYKHIAIREYPQNYCGPDRSDYYKGVGQCRDSGALSRSNFKVMLERLGGESKTVVVQRDNHWAVGWVEQILVHKSAKKKLRLLDEMMGDLKDYPVLDEFAFSQEEQDELDGLLDACEEDFNELVLGYIGRTRARKADLREFHQYVLQEDMYYRGVENAYVSTESIQRFVNTHEFQQLLKTNSVAKQIKTCGAFDIQKSA